MERLLVLVRHGQSDWNLKNLFTGWKDPDLSELGVKEAHAAGQALKAKGLVFDRAFTSGLIRAQHTLEIMLAELGQTTDGETFMSGVAPLSEVADRDTRRVRVRRISEEMQKDEELMGVLRRIGAQPGESVAVVATDEGVMLGSGGESAEIVSEAAAHIFVTASDA